MLLCLWAPGSGGVPTLPVGSPLSGPVGVLPQSTTVAWLSLLWLGWLLVLVRFSCLRLRCGLWLVLVCTADRPSYGSVLLLRPGFLFFGLLEGVAFHRFPSPLVFLRDVVTLWGHWCLLSLLITNEGFHGWSFFFGVVASCLVVRL